MKTITPRRLAIILLKVLFFIFIIDLSLTFIAFLVSMKPKRVYRSFVSGQKVEVFYSGQGALGSDWISIKVDGETVGEIESTQDLGNITKVDCFKDSIIIYSVIRGNPDTCIVQINQFKAP